MGGLYKILSKLLASRLKGVIGKLVSSSQTAFVTGRYIMDGVLVVNEVLDLAKSEKRSCMVMNMDFEKAYDCVGWNFLRYLLRRMGFGERWLRWMEGYVFSSFMSVLVNASATKGFQVERGLRQGYHISLFLLILVMEALSSLMRKVMELGKFSGFKFNRDEEVTMLQFADDTVLVVDEKWDNIWGIKVILRVFQMMLGLKINFQKSKIYGVHVGDWCNTPNLSCMYNGKSECIISKQTSH